MLTDANKEWLTSFIRSHKARPRVLHIGNIANNAYNNAKILNQAGLDCDVICYDYYHIMGCPEWEDADYAGRIDNDFRPNWSSVDLKGFERPKWFAQGPLSLCVDYLLARRQESADVEYLWSKLKLASGYSPPGAREDKKTVLESVLKRGWLRLCTLSPRFGRLLLPAALAGYKWLKQGDLFDHERDPSKLFHNIKFLRNAIKIIDEFPRAFPDRKDLLTLEDLIPFQTMYERWDRLFGHYDFIIGLSTDPILPLLAGIKYFAMEHGTLRSIPFEANGQGRRTAIAYNKAEHCFVTNFDCAESAEILASGRYTLINHPYDEDHGDSVRGSEERRSSLLKRLDCDFLFFHPTRHDWVHGTGYADKSNDIFLRAFAQLRKAGARVGLVTCSWGANLVESKKLLNDQGCSGHVLWVPPLPITPFERMCMACDLVVDQFMLGSFGGVAFKAMAVGAPIVTYLDEGQVTRQYSNLPPVIDCRTTNEILVAVCQFLEDPRKLKEIGAQSREWMKRYHGKRETVNKQVDQFRISAPV